MLQARSGMETYLKGFLIVSSHPNGVGIPVFVKEFFQFGLHVISFVAETFLHSTIPNYHQIHSNITMRNAAKSALKRCERLNTHSINTPLTGSLTFVVRLTFTPASSTSRLSLPFLNHSHSHFTLLSPGSVQLGFFTHGFMRLKEAMVDSGTPWLSFLVWRVHTNLCNEIEGKMK
jgi:hypothetical protein